ncbi:acyl-CoA thioesterase [Streptomyces sp. NPDC058001]|uniref:acyl-CoA thioesterase n=1 Tax=Streptomyces sp. NPDC058001 TaxID=3346300 RepID=UPI0036E82537
MSETIEWAEDEWAEDVSLPAGNGARAFGGGTLALMMTAADRLAAPGASVHSVHASFLRPGRTDGPAHLRAVTLRASRSFTTVRVVAEQRGRAVTTATVSFHVPAASRAHAACLVTPPRSPAASPPASGGPIPAPDAPTRAGFDLRDAGAGGTVRRGDDGRPVVAYWVRARVPVEAGIRSAAALAWVSDLCLTRVADLEHEHAPGTRRAASLDHAMWFHAPVDLDGWLLYELTSPAYGDGLALSTGRFHDSTGRLVASVAQQSLLLRGTEGDTEGDRTAFTEG